MNQEPVENRDFDVIEREMTAIVDFCREPPYPSRMLVEEHFLKKILAKTPNPVYLKKTAPVVVI
ncbi:MAG: hypothetical protein UC928_06240 [Collinsella sp.]|nr:hypothetical protein [Collinsella sp.]